MNPHHHLDAATLLGFSAGALPDAFSVVVAAHLEVCAHCRAQLGSADRIGGQLLRQQEGAPLASGAREALMARLDADPVQLDRPASPAPVRGRADEDLLPAALRPYFGERYSTLRWRMIGPGVHHIRSRDVDDSHLMLLRTSAGRSIPMHSHGGNELTMILRGAYDDALGHFGAGDVADLDCDVEHQPVTAPGVPCICVAATDAPLRFRGWIARTLQPLFGL
ncbi:ChrR family anti-sigma-E factor [Marilutibacter spongiae]|uniref:Cupin domain-containing protein n=1 Tax=Marilutibacter spongiae TaxID=2025720 RepID=A0A7W3Y537_9GAMM|nr:ChrR family anti-sigma-E factor [Lysobacter spongiae]MBB1059580.1 cupin domain-containing protein [Lysobacter spongiae]